MSDVPVRGPAVLCRSGLALFELSDPLGVVRPLFVLELVGVVEELVEDVRVALE